MTAVFKRLIWWASGAVMGAGGSIWAQRKVKRVVKTKVAAVQDTLHPKHLAGAAKGRVVHAIDQGRNAKTRRELELRDRVEDVRTRPAHHPGRPSARPPATRR